MKKEVGFLFNIVAAQKLYICTVVIQYILTLILQWRRVMTEPDSTVLGICRTADFLINF